MQGQEVHDGESKKQGSHKTQPGRKLPRRHSTPLVSASSSDGSPLPTPPPRREDSASGPNGPHPYDLQAPLLLNSLHPNSEDEDYSDDEEGEKKEPDAFPEQTARTKLARNALRKHAFRVGFPTKKNQRRALWAGAFVYTILTGYGNYPFCRTGKAGIDYLPHADNPHLESLYQAGPYSSWGVNAGLGLYFGLFAASTYWDYWKIYRHLTNRGYEIASSARNKIIASIVWTVASAIPLILGTNSNESKSMADTVIPSGLLTISALHLAGSLRAVDQIANCGRELDKIPEAVWEVIRGLWYYPRTIVLTILSGLGCIELEEGKADPSFNYREPIEDIEEKLEYLYDNPDEAKKLIAEFFVGIDSNNDLDNELKQRLKNPENWRDEWEGFRELVSHLKVSKLHEANFHRVNKLAASVLGLIYFTNPAILGYLFKSIRETIRIGITNPLMEDIVGSALFAPLYSLVIYNSDVIYRSMYDGGVQVLWRGLKEPKALVRDIWDYKYEILISGLNILIAALSAVVPASLMKPMTEWLKFRIMGGATSFNGVAGIKTIAFFSIYLRLRKQLTPEQLKVILKFEEVCAFHEIEKAYRLARERAWLEVMSLMKEYVALEKLIREGETGWAKVGKFVGMVGSSAAAGVGLNYLSQVVLGEVESDHDLLAVNNIAILAAASTVGTRMMGAWANLHRPHLPDLRNLGGALWFTGRAAVLGAAAGVGAYFASAGLVAAGAGSLVGGAAMSVGNAVAGGTVAGMTLSGMRLFTRRNPSKNERQLQIIQEIKTIMRRESVLEDSILFRQMSSHRDQLSAEVRNHPSFRLYLELYQALESDYQQEGVFSIQRDHRGPNLV